MGPLARPVPRVAGRSGGALIDAYASQPHYWQHLAPIWDTLPAEHRGTLYMAGRAKTVAPPDAVLTKPTPRATRPVLVASYSDARACRGRRYVYLEHGSGQTYSADEAVARHPSYSGGREHENCLLFLTPNETVATRWRAAYPDAMSVAVGVPKMDRWHRDQRSIDPRSSTVALSFHWQNALVPESRSAWPHYDAALPMLRDWAAENGITLLGHGHPRLWSHLGPRWRQLGIEATPDFDEVLARASLYVCDNSSTLYEFASLDRPVVVLNAPWYRRDVHHGLRFWDAADVGVQCDEPGDLPDAILLALDDPSEVRERRQEIVERVYPLRDGRAAERAAAAIVGLLSATPVPTAS